MGFPLVLYLAALKDIPRDLFENAEIEGASRIQVIRFVVIPLVRHATLIGISIGIVLSLKVFDLVFLMAGGYLAIGAFVSALTRNQVIAFIVAAALCFVFTASGLGVVLEFFSGWAPQWVLEVVANLSFLEHFRDIARGVIDVRGAVFFVSTIVFFLFANVVAVATQKNV